MSKIKYELFGCDAEISAFETDAATELLLDFGRSLEGLVSIENVVSRVTGGVCRFDSRLVDQGEHTPMLILKDKVITLPGIVKAGGSTLGTFQLEQSSSNNSQCQNIEPMFVTFVKSKLLRSNVVKPLHSLNIPYMSATLLVSNDDKFNSVNSGR